MTPVHQTPLPGARELRLDLPSRFAKAHVNRAPIGAARLNRNRWPLAARLLKPCLRRTDVRPKAAGALWTKMATKTMRPRVFCDEGVVEEAPSAMPSAKEWMTSPIVVEREWECGLRGFDVVGVSPFNVVRGMC